MGDIVSKAVRQALNDPVRRFLLMDAYLARKAEEAESLERTEAAAESKDPGEATSSPRSPGIGRRKSRREDRRSS